jgi:hypothetical protein
MSGAATGTKAFDHSVGRPIVEYGARTPGRHEHLRVVICVWMADAIPLKLVVAH